MAQKLEFALGAAVILTPQYGIPVFVATTVGKFVLTFRKRKTRNSVQTEISNGKQQVSLQWSHVSCKITTKKGETKHLLRDQSAMAKPDRLLAIMGPSGSGKTTLLNTLARQVACQKNLDLAGNLLVNGQPIETANFRQGYVQQEDMFFSQLTVRETLMMAAHTRMPGHVSASEKTAFVEDLIKRLGLTKAADSVVGDKKKRGLSGGEKKRLSIGAELIAQPTLLFTDEPTTGLDSFQAEKVAAINTAMGSLVKTCTTFPQERTIVTRERSKRSYEVGPYFLAKLLAELPIGALFPGVFGTLVYPTTGLHRKWSRFARFMGITCLESFTASSMGLAVGSIAPTGDAAQALGPAIMTVFIVFGGYYANASNVPKGLRWIAHTSLIKYAFEAFCVNEFKGLTFVNDKPGARVGSEAGEEVLDRLSFGNSSVRRSAQGLTRVMLFNYWLTYSVLKAKKPKFERMRAPTATEMGQKADTAPHRNVPSMPASMEVEVPDVPMSSGPSHNGSNGNGTH